jgi:phage-related protein
VGQWFAARWTDIQNALASVATWFQTKFQEAYNNVTRIFQAVGQWFAARWTDIQNALASVATWFQDKFSDAYENVKQAFEKIGDWFTEKYNAVTKVFEKIPDFFKQKFGDAVEAIKDVFGGIVDWFDDIVGKIKGFFDGLIDSIFGAQDAAEDVADSAGSKNSKSRAPAFATGGILRSGMGIVAEAGPELIEIVNGNAIITPLAKTATNTPVSNGSATARGGEFQQINNFFSPKPIDPYEAARQQRNANRMLILALQS